MLTIKQNNSDYAIDYEISVENYNDKLQLDKREAVRGISLQGSKILVVYTKDDNLYGTPGGGVEGDETLLETLHRELYEEVGALTLDNIQYLGKINELRPGLHSDKIFNPVMNYFLVTITKQGVQHLIEYEKELDLQCKYVDINEVIENNELLLQNHNKNYSWFYHFQTELFKIIKELYSL